MSRQAKLGLALGAAALLAAVLIATSLIATRAGGTKAIASDATLPRADEVVAELRGIPQQRFTLGREDAPVTLVEYADMQCPLCARWAADVFPELVRDYVRAGKLRLEWRGVAFIGPGSVVALRAVDAAALQNRLWHMAQIVFLSQGRENSGWVTDDFIRAAARSVGLDAGKLLADRNSAFVANAIARSAGATRTPAFELGQTGQDVRVFEPSSLGLQAFKTAIEEQLRR